MVNRRTVIAAAGGVAAVGVTALPRLMVGEQPAMPASAPDWMEAMAGRKAVEPATDAFTAPMPIMPTLRPTGSVNGVLQYQVPIEHATVDLLPGKPSQILSYGGQSIMGPTIRATVGQPISVRFANNIDAPTNVHLHGGHVPAASDGHPMDLISPGGTKDYYYPNAQRGTTLWYHAHGHGTEAEHVYRGMQGFYILDDPAESRLNLPSGQFDVPIAFRDAAFDETGQLVPGVHLGDRSTLLVNGKPKPYFAVAARKYRLRLLNSANERTLRLNLSGTAVTQIGTDGGLLPVPVRRTELHFGSGERVDIVVDFSRFPLGSQVVLADQELGPILRFDVTSRAYDSSSVPPTLRALPPLGTPVVEREVTLSFDLTGSYPVGLVNGKAYDPNRVDFTVKRGTTEIWTIVNGDGALGVQHNFHMHLVQFRVLDRDGQPPGLDDRGLKDTVDLPAGTRVRVQATFYGDYTGRYAYHCHFLDHSAIGMMAQMEIVP